MSDDEPPLVVMVRLDDLRQVLDAATSNPYLGDSGGGLDYLDRLEAALNCTGKPGCPAEGHGMTPVPGMEPS